jgi:hypothetical protein
VSSETRSITFAHRRFLFFYFLKGNYEKAMTILDDVEDYFGACLAIVTRKVGLARRSGKLEEVEKLYEHYVDLFNRRGNRAQADALSIKLCRFVDRALKDSAKAEKIVTEALDKSPVSTSKSSIL